MIRLIAKSQCSFGLAQIALCWLKGTFTLSQVWAGLAQGNALACGDHIQPLYHPYHCDFAFLQQWSATGRGEGVRRGFVMQKGGQRVKWWVNQAQKGVGTGLLHLGQILTPKHYIRLI